MASLLIDPSKKKSKYQSAIDVVKKENDELKKKREQQPKEKDYSKSDYADALRAIDSEKEEETSRIKTNQIAPSAYPQTADNTLRLMRMLEEQEAKKSTLSASKNIPLENSPFGKRNPQIELPTYAHNDFLPNSPAAKAARQKAANESAMTTGVVNDPVLSRGEYLASMASAGLDTSLESTKATIGSAFDKATTFVASLLGMKQGDEYNKYRFADSVLKGRALGSKYPTLTSFENAAKNGVETSTSTIDKANAASKKAELERLKDYAKNNSSQATLKKIQERYSDKEIGEVAQLLGNFAYSAGYGALSNAARIASPAAAAALMGTQEFSESYARAINEFGYSDSQALEYAAHTALRRGGEELILGQFGKGIADKAIAKPLSKIANPYARAAADVGITAAGEAGEQALGYLADIATRSWVGDENAKVDPKELGYQGVLGGATSLVFGLASYPGKVRLYKQDYNFVNNLSKAAEKVKNKQEADTIKKVADIAIDRANVIIDDPNYPRDYKASVNHIKDAAEDIKDIVENFQEAITYEFEEKDGAFTIIMDNDNSDTVKTDVQVLANVVAKYAEPDENIVNKTVDTIRDKIQDIKHEQELTTNPDEKAELQKQIEKLKEVDVVVRSNRDEIEAKAEESKKNANANNANTAAKSETDIEPAKSDTAASKKVTNEKPATDVSNNQSTHLQKTAEHGNQQLTSSDSNAIIENEQTQPETQTTSKVEAYKQKLRDAQTRGEFRSVEEILGNPDSDIHYSDLTDADRDEIYKISDEKQIEFNRKEYEAQNAESRTLVDNAVRSIKDGKFDNKGIVNDALAFYDENGNKRETHIVNQLMKDFGIEVPLATQGWFNKRLISFRYENGASVVRADLKGANGRTLKVPDNVYNYLDILGNKIRESSPDTNNSNAESAATLPATNNEVPETIPTQTATAAEQNIVKEPEPNVTPSAPAETAETSTTAAESPTEIAKEIAPEATAEPQVPKDFDLTRKEYTHTKTGEKSNLYTIDKYIGKDQYAELKKRMEAVGGKYSKFAGGFLVPFDKATSVSEFANVTEPVVHDKSEGADLIGVEYTSSGLTYKVLDYLENGKFLVDIGGFGKDGTSRTTEELSRAVIERDIADSETKTDEPETPPTVPNTETDASTVTAASTKQALDMLKNAPTAFGVEINGGSFVSDGAAIIRVSKEQLSEIKADLKKQSKAFENVDAPTILDLEHITPAKKLPETTYTQPGGLTLVEFENPQGEPTYIDNKYLKYFDKKGNIWGFARFKSSDSPNYYALAATDDDGNLNGIIMPVRGNTLDKTKPMVYQGKSKLQSETTTTKQTTEKEIIDSSVKDKHRAMESGVLPDVAPEATTEVKGIDAGNGVQTETVASDSLVNTFYSQIADRIMEEYLSKGASLDINALRDIATSIYGGTLAEGRFDSKDMTDALELAVNRYLLGEMQNKIAEFNGNTAKSAEDGIVWMEELLARIPTQTKRTEEQLALQQFSTPPNIAYLANWLADIDSSDFVLEPSAGIGGLATFAKAFGATTAVNEISERRLGALRSLGFDHVTSENAEQLDNILPDYIKPTVVVMNPPFSSTGGRTKNSSNNVKPHVEQALNRLQDNGRLVAILGQGASNDAPMFAKWWDSLREQGYDIRANIGIDGSNYRKYGTTFNVRLVVIDKNGTNGKTITGDYTKLYEIPKALEEIRNDRRKNIGTAEPNRTVESNKRASGGTRNASDDGRTVSDTVPGGNATDVGSGNAVERRVSSDSGRSIRSEPDTVKHIQPDTGTAVSGNNEQSGGRGLPSGNDENVTEVAQSESGRGIDESIAGGRESSDRNLSVDRRQSGNADVESLGGKRNGGVTAPPKKTNTQKKKANTSDDGIYAGYVPSKLTVKNAQKHPANLVESSAMAAVSAPTITYTPHIDQNIIDKGLISDVQLENISYAGQAHEEVLESGERRGYFIGDGTGVGKGRQAAGIILDNFNQGRKKALWISEKAALMEDAKRDWRDIGGNPDDIFNIDGIRKGIGKGKDKVIPSDGILFTAYSTVRAGKTKDSKTTNADRIIEWLGKDFDGVIIYDEAHNMNTLLAKDSKNGSQQAIEANKIQEKLPNARVVYMSATGAVEVKDLCFASRLGLWGKGTQFTSAEDFVEKIGASGVAGMELVASSLKAMGAYQARSISYDGVKYDSIKHTLTKNQRVMYDTFCEAWQITLQNMEKAISSTKVKNAGTARSLYYSAMQNFYNQVLSSMAMPSVIEDINKEIANGHSCVIQLINTNEAQQNRELAKVKAEGNDLDDLDITPRGALLGFLENSFPVQQYEEYIDEHGNNQSRPVFDSAGNPVLNKQAVAARNALVERVKEMSIPEGPIDMIINAFGADKVAEVTGRSRRIVEKVDENGNKKKVEEALKPDFRISETTAFQNGEKHILIFSNAGSTGRSYHADKRAKNQEQRIHYVLQPGWNAKTATQGFGRTHRSNQVSAPVYKLITTDIEGQRRFVTSIARRLDQLGALTKGQRQTGSGIFGEKDNLESPLSRDALRIFYKRLGTGAVPGVDGKEIFRKLGLYRDFYDKDDKFRPSNPKSDDITTFLNRLLALKVDEQNIVFGEFETLRQQMYDEAIANGTLDTGISNVKADKITVDQEETIYTDAKTGAETKYVKATAYRKPQIIASVDDAKVYKNAFQGFVRMQDGAVRAVYRIADETDTFGRVMKKYLLQSPNRSIQSRYNEVTMRQKTTTIPESDWDKAWADEIKSIPDYNESTLNIITGALLPVWNKLPQDGNIKALKIVTDSGDQILGRIIPSDRIDGVLRGLDIKQKVKTYTGTQIYDAVLKKGAEFKFSQSYTGTNTIKRSRVSGENRIEITGSNIWALRNDYPEIFSENIQYTTRYFIPTGVNGKKIIESLNNQYKMQAQTKDTEPSVFYSKNKGKWGKGDKDGNKLKSLNDLKEEAHRMFGVEINTGKIGARGAEGIYNTHAGTIRTRVHGDLPTIAHELGHHFDKKYNLVSMDGVEELVDYYRAELEEADYNESLFPYEAVANYFADLMRDQKETAERFKTFTSELGAALKGSDAKHLPEYINMTNEYFAADRIRRREAQVHYRHKDESFVGNAQFQVDTFRRNPAAYTGRLSRKFIRHWFDDVVDLKKFGSAHDLAFKERAANSIADGRLTIAFTDNHDKVIGRSLASVLEEGGINDLNAKSFDAYLTARIALDRIEAAEKNNGIGSKVYADTELQDKDNLISDIQTYELKNPTFADTAKGVYEYENHLLDVAVDSGLISSELSDELRELYPHYVPLYRSFRDGSAVSSGRGAKTPPSVVKRFKGSGRDVLSPVENIMNQTVAWTKAILQNETRKAVFDVIDDTEDMGIWAEKVPASMFRDTVTTDEVAKKLANFSSDKIEHLSEDEKAELVDDIMETIGSSTGMWKKKLNQGKNIVSVMRSGQPEYYEIHDDGLMEALLSLTPQQMNIWLQLVSKTTNLFTALTTGTNPKFGYNNLIRDTSTGYIFSETQNNPFGYVLDLFKAFGEAITESDDYKMYLANGGGYTGAFTMNTRNMKNEYQKLVKHHSKLKRIFESAMDFFPRINNSIESASRYAEYKRKLKEGVDSLEALRASQNITVNFQQGGKYSKFINKFIPFFNASLTSLYQNVSRLNPKNKRTIIKWLVSMIWTAVSGVALNEFINKYILDDDDDFHEAYANLSTYNKFANNNIYIGDGQFIRIPKEQTLMIPATLSAALYEKYAMENPEAFYKYGEYIVDAILPPGPRDTIILGSIIDLAKNETFTGAPIESKAEQYKAAETRYNGRTSKLAIAAAPKINLFLNEFGLELSPIQINYLLDDNTGWVGDFLINLTKFEGTSAKEVADLSDTSEKSLLRGIPVPNVILRDSTYSTDIVTRFYDKKTEYDQNAASYKALQKEGKENSKYTFYDTYGKYKFGKVADLYSDVLKRIKADNNKESSRHTRSVLNELIKSVNETEVTQFDKDVAALAKETGCPLQDIAPYIVVPESLKDSQKNAYELDAYDMMEYYTESQILFEYWYNEILSSGYDEDSIAGALKDMKKEIKQTMDERYLAILQQ